MLSFSIPARTAVAFSLLTLAWGAHASLVSLGSGTAEVHASAKGLGGFDGSIGRITASEKDGKLVFTANLTQGLDMGIRNRDTFKRFKIVTKEEAAKGKQPTLAKVTVAKDKLRFPEDKKTATGSAPATLSVAGKNLPVNLRYQVSRTGSDYHVKGASFTFDYTRIIPMICLPGGIICVKEPVKIKLKELKLRDRS